MDTRVRRRLAPEARKLEIIEAAERLLQSQGARVRVEDVVREAGVAKGTFFLYFPTWDDLLEAIRSRLVFEFDASYPLPTEVEAPVDWPGLVEWQAEAFIDFTLTRQGLGEALFHSDFDERRPLADNGVVRIAAV
ncbi:MAG TPA: helix-turn-helix domain-containing protein, partial [Phenylobacterium sp.]